MKWHIILFMEVQPQSHDKVFIIENLQRIAYNYEKNGYINFHRLAHMVHGTKMVMVENFPWNNIMYLLWNPLFFEKLAKQLVLILQVYLKRVKTFKVFPHFFSSHVSGDRLSLNFHSFVVSLGLMEILVVTLSVDIGLGLYQC